MELDAGQRKEFIILYAIELMSEKGIHNISTKEIAKRLQISEGMIFKLYPKKSDIIIEILERFSLYDTDMFYTAMDKNENAMDALRFYIASYLTYYESYPAITAVYQSYDAFKGDDVLEQKSRSIFFGRINDITRMLKKAQESGLVRTDIDAENVATMLSSITRGMCLKRRLSDTNFPLKEKTIEAINLVLAAIQV